VCFLLTPVAKAAGQLYASLPISQLIAVYCNLYIYIYIHIYIATVGNQPQSHTFKHCARLLGTRAHGPQLVYGLPRIR